MTINIPEQLEKSLGERAAERRISIEQLIQEALEWYLQIDSELLDELSAWQEVRDEAFRISEGTSS